MVDLTYIVIAQFSSGMDLILVERIFWPEITWIRNNFKKQTVKTKTVL